ncbi:MAG: glycosyltransferase [Desulfosalsimonas sp.]
MANNTFDQNPLVSVIIPVYNRRAWIAQAVDSVLCQNYKPFELIVVDDGSTDGTMEILSAYGNKIRVIRQPNSGVSAARNKGAAAAEGNLLAFLDSDDYWLSGKLAAQVEFFRKNPDIRICQTEEIWIRKGKRVNPGRRHRKSGGMIFEKSLELCMISPSAVMMKKDLFDERGGFDENLPACEDYDLWLKITCTEPVGLINTPLIVKRGGHPDQLSAAAGLDRFRIQSLLHIMASTRLTDSQYKAAAGVLEKKCRIYAQGCKKRGKYDEAAYYRKIASTPFSLFPDTSR